MKTPDEKEIKLITTDDGSHSLFVPSLNETYHSFHGAVRESRHVFVDMGLRYRITTNPQETTMAIRIFEVGFGTGLNALLTAEFAKKQHQPLHYTTIEAFPLTHSLVEKLNYPSFLTFPDASEWLKQIHDASWEEEHDIHANFTLKKIRAKLEDFYIEPAAFDVIYFDAFAPGKQAELWDIKILKNISQAMATGAVFVTYCARGQLKRDLQALGLKVDTLPGPPGKKEMVRAIKS